MEETAPRKKLPTLALKHTHFCPKKIIQKKHNFLQTYLPYFFRIVTGNKHFFLGLIVGFNLSCILDARGKQWGRVVRCIKNANMTSHNGQHSKPAAQILPCPSEYCKFQLVTIFWCPGVSGWIGVGRGDVVWYNKTKMTSQHGQHGKPANVPQTIIIFKNVIDTNFTFPDKL